LVRVLQVDGVVTAHDTPGFGLTQRPQSLDAYTSAFNGQLGRALLDMHRQDGTKYAVPGEAESALLGGAPPRGEASATAAEWAPSLVLLDATC
jgi:hypothetical protein